jgi:hypothetical protein
MHRLSFSPLALILGSECNLDHKYFLSQLEPRTAAFSLFCSNA